MDNVELIFKDRTNDISFLELKENSSIVINGYVVDNGLPLPVITDTLVKDIKKGNLEEEINLINVIEGIIYLIGADPEFKYVDDYIKLLRAYKADIEDYMFIRGIKEFDNKNLILSGIYFRAIMVLDNKNTKANFNYALVLEELGKKNIGTNRIEEGEELLLKAINQLEEILKIDDKYSLAYYKLGFFYRYSEQYLKAQLIWKQFLVLDRDENRLQEIREEIDSIEDNVRFETGITYLNYNEFGKAVEFFLKLLPKYKDDFNTNFLIGISYKGMGEYDYAWEYLNKAFEIDSTNENVINQMQDLEDLFNNK